MSPRKAAADQSPRERFEATKRAVTTLLPTIDGLEAEGYLGDLGDLLRAMPGLAAVRVRKTSDPLRRYEAEARLAERADAAAMELVAAWSGFAYSDEAHHAAVDAGGVVLEFVTWLPERWHVTGRVTLIGTGMAR